MVQKNADFLIEDERVDNSGKELWELDIEEISGHIIESKGRSEVNDLLASGWILLHIYTLRYKDDQDVWRERPMAILGRPRSYEPDQPH